MMSEIRVNWKQKFENWKRAREKISSGKKSKPMKIWRNLGK